MDTGKKRMGFAIVCAVLIAAMGTGFVFAANATTGNTTVAEIQPLVIVEQYANRFEKYKDYGLTYDKAANRLYYNGELVRYFGDYYPVSEDSNAYAGTDYFNENGTIDVHGVRDLSNIIHNADGSYDPSGKLTGVAPYSQAEFDARDIAKLKNPPQLSTTIQAENDMTYSTPQTPQQNSNDTDISIDTVYLLSDVTDNGLNNQGKTIPQWFADYKEYGVTFDENSINGGMGNVY
jgi:hypothetical protein